MTCSIREALEAGNCLGLTRPAETVEVILMASSNQNWLHTDTEVELTEDWGRYAANALIVRYRIFYFIYSGDVFFMELISNCIFVYRSDRQEINSGQGWQSLLFFNL